MYIARQLVGWKRSATFTCGLFTFNLRGLESACRHCNLQTCLITTHSIGRRDEAKNLCCFQRLFYIGRPPTLQKSHQQQMEGFGPRAFESRGASLECALFAGCVFRRVGAALTLHLPLQWLVQTLDHSGQTRATSVQNVIKNDGSTMTNLIKLCGCPQKV